MIIRAFIAIEIDKLIRKNLSGYINQLKSTGADVKWVSPENIHLTLSFLGYIEEETLQQLNSIINDAISCVNPFSINIGNIGAFPSLKKPRVVYVCVQDKENNLPVLYEKLNNGVKELGIKTDSKKFAGHITLGRTRSQKNIPKLKDALNSGTESFFGIEKVNYISLIQSKLTPTGPIYTRLNNFLLN